MKALYAVFLALVLLAGGALALTNNAYVTDPDVAEAVFLYEFQQMGARGISNPVTYFLAIDESSPSASFLARFAGRWPPVDSLSASELDQNGMIVDLKSGSLGILFHVEEMTRVDEGVVQVRGGYTRGNGELCTRTYDVRRGKDVWVVESTIPMVAPTSCIVHNIPLMRKTAYAPEEGILTDPAREYSEFIASISARERYPNSTPWYVSDRRGGLWQREQELRYCPECDRELRQEYLRWRKRNRPGSKDSGVTHEK